MRSTLLFVLMLALVVALVVALFGLIALGTVQSELVHGITEELGRVLAQ